MQIDWFTVIAQVVNFLLLVWLLKRFLYKPVLNMIDAREKRIAEQLREASEKQQQSRQQLESLRQEQAQFNDQRAAAWAKVESDTRAARDQQLEKVRADGASLREQMQAAVEEERQKIRGSIVEKVRAEVFAIAGQALADLGDVHLGNQMAQVLISRLSALPQEEAVRFKEAFLGSGRSVRIVSAVELSSAARTELEKAVGNVVGEEAVFEYDVDPSLVSGIEIASRDYKIAWTIEQYLQDLQQNIETKNRTDGGK